MINCLIKIQQNELFYLNNQLIIVSNQICCAHFKTHPLVDYFYLSQATKELKIFNFQKHAIAFK